MESLHVVKAGNAHTPVLQKNIRDIDSLQASCTHGTTDSRMEGLHDEGMHVGVRVGPLFRPGAIPQIRPRRAVNQQPPILCLT